MQPTNLNQARPFAFWRFNTDRNWSNQPPIESPVTSQIKTINGLAIASVKTINGLAIASVKTFNGLANT
jgi:hypothetical protein